MLAIEREILRMLCQIGSAAELSREVARHLQNYSWQGTDHQTIFEAAICVGNTQAGSLREQLAAQATRMGFPDIDWDDFVEPRARGKANSRHLTELLQQLKAASAQGR